MSPKSTSGKCLLSIITLLTFTHALIAADPAPPATSPASDRAVEPNTPTPAPGGRPGGRFGGAPLTDADRAAIARLAELPAWKPGVGDGDYVTSPPYAPAPENAPRDGVPRGKVVTFHMERAAAFKAKGYAYQFVYTHEAGHVDRPVRAMTLAPALEWLWKDYQPVAQ